MSAATPEPAAMTPERREQLRGRIAACIDDTPDVVGWETARHLLAEVDRLTRERDEARAAATPPPCDQCNHAAEYHARGDRPCSAVETNEWCECPGLLWRAVPDGGETP